MRKTTTKEKTRKTTTMNRLPHTALLALLAAPLAAQDATAIYDVTFDATWSATTHPGAFPGGAHFSPLVGGTHGPGVTFWQPGGLASPGMESMAETGATSALVNEVNTAITAGTAGEVILGAGIGSPASTTTSFALSNDHPLVTIVTMIAPSPDWFLGVHGLNLYENDSWVAQKTVQLFAYDAGTDSGVAFTSLNLDTNPQDPITLMTGGPFFGAVPLGTFQFTRRGSIEPYGCGINPDGSLTFTDPPAVGQDLVFGVNDPGASMAIGSLPFVAVSALAVPAYPCGIVTPGLGMAAPGADGEILLVVPPIVAIGPPWTGTSSPVAIPVPDSPTLIGQTFIAQGGLFDIAASRIGLSQGVRCYIGP